MRVLITSDIHINQFSSYNMEDDPYFRLHQFDKLAKRFLDIIHEQGVGAVMIAGDFLHVASPRPFVVNAAGKFLKTLSQKVPVFVTHGQHDYDSRTHMSRENSLLSLYDNIDGVQYLHKNSITLDGTSFWFQGWTPEQDFSQVQQGQFDVLIGHATVNGAIMNNYGTTANGPEFANSKFKFCFMGDIHKPQVIKNIVIPGPPIQANFGDNPDNSVIVLDTADLSWKRYSTHGDSNIRFLRFITSNTAKTVDDPYTIVRRARKEKASSKEVTAKSVDVLETIEHLAVQEQLQETHALAMSVTSKLEDDDLDLDYTINNVKISNFRSIKSLEWTPLTGITLIIGKIGTGKSTLVQAIRFALLGHRAPKSLVMFGEEAMSVSIDITYAGTNHLITRGFQKRSGFVKYTSGGTEIESENQTECNNRIRGDLKFLSLYDTLHRSQQNIYFLENHSYAERVALISKVIRLGITDRLKLSAEKLREPLVLELQEKLQKDAGARSFIKNLESMNLQQDDADYDALNKKNTEISGQINMLLDLEKRLGAESSEHTKLLFAKSQLVDEDLPHTLPDISDQKVSLEKSILQLQGCKQDLKLLNSSQSDQLLKSSRLQAQILSADTQIKDCDGQVQKITSNICYTCNQTIDKHLTAGLNNQILEKKASLQNEQQNIKEQADQVRRDLDQTRTSIEKSESTIQELERQISSKRSEIAQYEALKQKIQRRKTILENIKNVEDRKSTLEGKISLFRTTMQGRYGLSVKDEQAAVDISQTLRDNALLYKEKKASQDKMKHLLLETGKQKQLIQTLEEEISALQEKVVCFDKYIELVGPKGQVVRSVLTTVSENMSNENLRVVAFKKLSNEEVRPDFNVFLKVADRWINYDELSGGQKSLCDLFVLNHLVEMAGGAGSLVLDETFSQVGFEDLEPAVDALKAMPVKHIFVVSHHENFPAYDNMILTNFDDSGVTTYTMPNGE